MTQTHWRIGPAQAGRVVVCYSGVDKIFDPLLILAASFFKTSSNGKISSQAG
jgi:hypothetical protein